jgi:multidrug/hemolysin transport system permease protein
MFKTAGLILLATMANTSLVCFMASFFKSQQAFGTASTVIGTLIGFLTGIYLPVGNLPASVQTVIKVFPISHSAVLFRQVLMADPMASTFAERGCPAGSFKEFMGVTIRLAERHCRPLQHCNFACHCRRLLRALGHQFSRSQKH